MIILAILNVLLAAVLVFSWLFKNVLGFFESKNFVQIQKTELAVAETN
jgi:hypothetical protein